MNQTLERIRDIEKNGYQIDFANVFNHAFENYKKIVLYAGSILVIFTILFFIFTAVSLGLIPGAAEIAEDISSEKLKLENVIQANLLVINIISLFTSSLLSPFLVSFLKMADYGDRDENFPVSFLFSYYKLPYLKEIIISTFLISVINLAQNTLMTYLKFEFLGLIISCFISFITILTAPLIIFGNLGALDALKHSAQIVFKQPAVLLGLIIVSIIGILVGFMACCVGIFFTFPFIYSMKYAIYSAIVGIDTPLKNED